MTITLDVGLTFWIVVPTLDVSSQIWMLVQHFLDLAVAKSLQSTRMVTDDDDADDDADV